MNKFYFLLPFALIAQVAFGQAPGGVSTNLKLWIHAGTGTSTTTNGASVTTWAYANDGTKVFNNSGATPPSYNSAAINFLPAVTFSGNQLMDGPNGVNAPIAAGKPDYSMFAVWRSSSLTSFQRVWIQGTTGAAGDGFSLATWNDARHICGNETEIAPYDNCLNAHFNTNVWNITQLNLLNQASNDQQTITDSNYSTGPALFTTPVTSRNLGNVINELGSKASAGNQALSGDIAEIIVFDRPINAGGERERVFSYLAMKYGIPLNANLVSSAGTTIWDNTVNATYSHGVFGLAKDNGSGLLVTKANSYTTGNSDGTGISGKGNIIISNPSALTADQTFFMVGNDNGGFGLTTSTLANAQRYTQRWRLQATGTTGSISLSFDFTGLTTNGATYGNPANYRLQIDQDGDGNFATGPQAYVSPAAFPGNNVVRWDNVGMISGSVFTVLTSSTPLPVTWRDFTATLENSNIRLNWQIDNNQDGKVFEVEHSTDGVNFTKVGEVANDPSIKSYTYLYTPTTSGPQYFRVHEVDFDGQAIYSRIISIGAKASDIAVRVIKNPVSDNFTILEINTNSVTTVSAELWTLGGSRLSTIQQTVSSGLSRINIPLGNAAAGHYILKIRAGSLTQTEQVIKL